MLFVFIKGVFMKIQGNAIQQNFSHQPNFKSSYVTLSKKNLGEKIAINVVDKFNSTIFPKIKETQIKEAESIISKIGKGAVISSAKDYQEKINFFTLGAGSGSRFKELAQTVGDYNKISLPFRYDKQENIHMLDFALAMGKYFIKEDGVQKIIASQPSGSFGDIV